MLYFQETNVGSIPYISGRMTSCDLEEFSKTGFPYLMLNSALGWDETSGGLSEVKDLDGRGLHILSLGKGFDVSELEGVKGLDYLYLGKGCKGRFEVLHHSRLKELRIFAETKKLKVIFSSGSFLERLLCNGGASQESEIA